MWPEPRPEFTEMNGFGVFIIGPLRLIILTKLLLLYFLRISVLYMDLNMLFPSMFIWLSALDTHSS